jgi:hypothetical protein
METESELKGKGPIARLRSRGFSQVLEDSKKRRKSWQEKEGLWNERRD